jgi:dTMP kinase
MTGVFITFEGGEGAGKSTQIKRLAEHLGALGHVVVLTREPGGTPAAEDVRKLLVNGDIRRYSSTAEALLNYAARDSHLRDVIAPALQRGETVLCDRFIDSTRAYQSIAGDCPARLIEALERDVVGSTMPNLTFVFDLDAELGLQRARIRGAGVEDRYERKGLDFHKALRHGFLEIAQREAGRCVVIDAGQSINTVWAQVLQNLNDRGYGRRK